jgi:Putative metallopeptidase
MHLGLHLAANGAAVCMRYFVLVVFAAFLLALRLAAAQDEPHADAIDIQYVEPTVADQKPVYEHIKNARVLEKIKRMLAPLRLPQRLLLKAESCGGRNDAWYDKGVVTVCYAFFDDIWKNVPEKTTRRGVTPVDAMVGPVVDTFLHEVGHAVFDLWKVPVLGREEDAADFFSVYLMLKFDKQQARRLIMGTAYQYREHVRVPNVSLPVHEFADEHALPQQRFYNVLCIAYGSDDALFADFVEKGYLPRSRAKDCKDEYKQVAYAFDKLLSPYIEPGLYETLSEHELPPASQQMKRRGAK